MTNIPKQKQKYSTTIEGLAPVSITVETFACDEQEALQQLNNPQLLTLKHRSIFHIQNIIRKKIQIKETLTSLIKLVKTY